MKDEKAKRVGFDLSPAMMKRMERCKAKLNAGSSAEVVRRALVLLDGCLNSTVYLRGADGKLRMMEVL